MSKIKRLEAIERRLLRPRLDAESLRQFTAQGIAEIAMARLDRLENEKEVRVCEGIFQRENSEGLETFKARVLGAVREAVMTEQMPLQGLSRLYRVLPRGVTDER